MIKPSNSSPIHVLVADVSGSPYWEAKFRSGKQIKRRIGPAWLVPVDSPDAKPNGALFKRGRWIQRRGRPVAGALTHEQAIAKASAIVAAVLEDQSRAQELLATADMERTRPRTFRELAEDWRRFLDRKGTKPSTLQGYDAMLADPGMPYRRGGGQKLGYIMSALGRTAAKDITVGHVEALLATISATGASARTIEKHRIMVRSILNYGIRQTKRALAGADSADGFDYGLHTNAAAVAEAPRQAGRGALIYYLPDEVEAIAEALEAGLHRLALPRHSSLCPSRNVAGVCDCSPVFRVGRLEFDDATSANAYLRDHRDEAALRSDLRDAAAVRVSAYTGLRLGELVALRWEDVDELGHVLTVSRSISSGTETAPKSGKVRRVPLPDQALTALQQLSKRSEFKGPHELVFGNASNGRHVDGSALRRRYKRAQAAAGVQALRWHDLRHTYGSLLAASGEELVTIKSVMGHANISTTELYLHARPATESASRFTKAFATRGSS